MGRGWGGGGAAGWISKALGVRSQTCSKVIKNKTQSGGNQAELKTPSSYTCAHSPPFGARSQALETVGRSVGGCVASCRVAGERETDTKRAPERKEREEKEKREVALSQR